MQIGNTSTNCFQAMNRQNEILGVGTPILDHLIHIEPSYLKTISGDPYGMELVSYEEMIAIIENSGTVPRQIAGGSCCNCIKGLAALGHQCGLTGKLGKGSTGEKVIEDLQDLNVEPLVAYSDTPTAHVACMITPEGKRTCRTFIGAGGEMRPEDLDPIHFQGVKLVHIEGYSLMTPGLTHQAMEYAKQAGAIISLDMGSFEVIKSYKPLLTDLIREYASIIFANEEEAYALTGREPESACSELRTLCDTVVVMMGEKGCCAGNRTTQALFPAFPVKPVDTTGAGDLFASGFLHGILTHKNLETCAKFGAITGGTVVQHVGAEIPSEVWADVQARIGSSLI